MESEGVISRVEEPTDWCVEMVVVPKTFGIVRICVDLTKLNKNVRRQRLMKPSVEQVLAQTKGAQVFSKLDANSGFWQIPLSKQSALLTAIIMPFGWYCSIDSFLGAFPTTHVIYFGGVGGVCEPYR